MPCTALTAPRPQAGMQMAASTTLCEAACQVSTYLLPHGKLAPAMAHPHSGMSASYHQAPQQGWQMLHLCVLSLQAGLGVLAKSEQLWTNAGASTSHGSDPHLQDCHVSPSTLAGQEHAAAL